mgnify:CR=1 FL=1
MHSNKEWLAEYTAYEQLYGRQEMKLNEVYESTSNFLKAEDLKGKTVRVKISKIDIHEFDQPDGKKKKQLVLSFEGKEKRLGLNITNANSIAKILGDDTDDWIGGEVKIYPTTTEFGDKKDIPCIRVIEELPPEDTEGVGF